MRAVGGLEGDIEPRRRARRAVDFFGRRRGQCQAGALAGRDRNIEAVTAGNAASGIDEHGR
jgi:hypothetical protein